MMTLKLVKNPFFFFLNFVWVHPCSCHIKGLGLEESLWELVSTLYFIEQGLLISAARQCTPGWRACCQFFYLCFSSHHMRGASVPPSFCVPGAGQVIRLAQQMLLAAETSPRLREWRILTRLKLLNLACRFFGGTPRLAQAGLELAVQLRMTCTPASNLKQVQSMSFMNT